MLDFLKGIASDRRLRLFAVACARRVDRLLTAKARGALEVAERFAEGHADAAERKAARAVALASDWVGPPDHPFELVRHARGSAKASVCGALARRSFEAARTAARHSTFALTQLNSNLMGMAGHEHTIGGWEALQHSALSAQASLVREVFGNPYSPVPLAPSSPASEAVSLATRIYAYRAFDRVPELAEHLEQGGCAWGDVIAHCRGPGPHVRGCWVVDLLLGKN